ncbi:MAG TPA: hypothetical protein VMU25_00670 [Candidatus Paceibacterota bacterium]|nr:hypothetical protein [Candidatus Paceibacterota bacterium]
MLPELTLLIFTACTSPQHCSEFTLQYDPTQVPLQTCQMMAQMPLAAWANLHPGYTVGAHHCETSDKHKTSI